MRTYVTLLVLLLSVSVSLGQTGFPFYLTRKAPVKTNSTEYQRRSSARPIPTPYTTLKGGLDIAPGTNTVPTWLTAPVSGTIASMVPQSVVALVKTVPFGKMWRLRGIEMELSDSATAFIQIQSGSVTIAGTVRNRPLKATTPGYNRLRWDFPEPLILRYGQKIAPYYWRGGSTPINTTLYLDGDELPADLNTNADYTMLVMGDSQSAITADAGADQTGSWAYIVRDSLIANGKNTYLDQRAIGGTFASNWITWINNEELVGMDSKFDIAFVNLGMNDVTSTLTGLSSFTANMVSIGKRLDLIARANSGGISKPIIFNAITPTDDATRSPYVASYNTAIQSVVTTLQGQGIPAYFSDVSSAYSSSTGTAYISTNQTAGTRVHANTTVGQPAMAAIIWNVIKTSTFGNKTPLSRM